MTDGNALFDLGNGPESEQEREVAALIASLEAEKPLTPVQKVVASMCRALAKSIAEGNRKGRSVANDVERLMSTMRELTGGDDDNDPTADDLTPTEREILDALQSVPARHGEAAEGYAA